MTAQNIISSAPFVVANRRGWLAWKPQVPPSRRVQKQGIHPQEQPYGRQVCKAARSASTQSAEEATFRAALMVREKQIGDIGGGNIRIQAGSIAVQFQNAA